LESGSSCRYVLPDAHRTHCFFSAAAKQLFSPWVEKHDALFGVNRNDTSITELMGPASCR